MTDVKYNAKTGQIAVPVTGGFKIYEKGQYKMNTQTGEYAIPSDNGWQIIKGGPKSIPIPSNMAAPGATDVTEPYTPPRSTGEELLRQVGLAGRYAVEGGMAAPNMVGNAANAAVNLGIKGVNALGADIPYLMKPSDATTGLLNKAGLPNPETATERIVAEPSKFLASIPAFGGAGQMLAKVGGEAAAPLATLGENMGVQAGGAIGGGTAYGVAKELFPNSPTAQITAALLGGAAGSGATSALANRLGGTAEAAIPTTQELKQAAQAAYGQADEAGAIVRLERLQQLSQNVQQNLAEFGYHPQLQPRIGTVLAELDRISQQPITTQGIQVLRRIASNAAISTDPSERALGGQIVGQIDDMLATLTPDDVIQGNAQAASDALRIGADLWRRFRKSEMIDEAIAKGTNRAASSGSGGNEENAIRQTIRSILDSPTKRRGFTAEEISAMQTVVRGAPIQNLARLIGKLSPSGNGLMAALGLGAVSTGGPLGIAPVAGLVAKPIAEALSRRNVANLSEIIRGGAQQIPQQIQLPPGLMGTLPALPRISQ